MSDNFTIQFNSKERDALLYGLNSIRNEYFDSANEVKSASVAEVLRERGRDYSRLYDRVANLMTRDEMNKNVETLIKAGKMIDAIKLVRATTFMGLKEAKQHVDNVRDGINAALAAGMP